VVGFPTGLSHLASFDAASAPRAGRRDLTAMIVSGLVERDAGNRLTLTEQGHATLMAPLAKGG
jgi:hypothetical protein